MRERKVRSTTGFEALLIDLKIEAWITVNIMVVMVAAGRFCASWCEWDGAWGGGEEGWGGDV